MSLYDADPTPFLSCVSALQLLALPRERFEKYVPCSMPRTLFHGCGGDLLTADPLVAVCSIVADCLTPGGTWDEWIDDPNFENRGIEERFDELTLKVERLLPDDWSKENRWREQLAGENREWESRLDECRELATNLLSIIGLFEPNACPVFSAEELFHDSSGGAYEPSFSNDA